MCSFSLFLSIAILTKYLILSFTAQRGVFSLSSSRTKQRSAAQRRRQELQLQRRICRFVNWSAQKEIEQVGWWDSGKESGTRLQNVTGLWQNAVGERQRFFYLFFSLFLSSLFLGFFFCLKTPPDVSPDNRVTRLINLGSAYTSEIASIVGLSAGWS